MGGGPPSRCSSASRPFAADRTEKPSSARSSTSDATRSASSSTMRISLSFALGLAVVIVPFSPWVKSNHPLELLGARILLLPPRAGGKGTPPPTCRSRQASLRRESVSPADELPWGVKDLPDPEDPAQRGLSRLPFAPRGHRRAPRHRPRVAAGRRPRRPPGRRCGSVVSGTAMRNRSARPVESRRVPRGHDASRRRRPRLHPRRAGHEPAA